LQDTELVGELSARAWRNHEFRLFGIGAATVFQTPLTNDYNVIYTESQDGNDNRYDCESDDR